MLDEANLRRLAEMGIDVYLPRGSAQAPVEVAIAEPVESAVVVVSLANEVQADVLLLADANSRPAAALLADVARALAFARVRSARMSSPDEAALGAASMLVAFGDARARAAGALLPAQRQREMAWVVSVELAELACSAQGKRALWSELRRSLRGLAARHGQARR
jgi:DNA polymerase III psi subunit